MSASRLETITLGGGCFWCLEAVYLRVDGVEAVDPRLDLVEVAVESGYSNGHVAAPSYEQVCGGDTGHAEVVRISFDAQRISLRELLAIFFVIHDPTTLNRQGNDIGTQYRSGIYFENPQQEAIARDVIAELASSGAANRPVVTEVLPLANYSRAEAYHQRYFEQHPDQGYCAYVVAPKVEKFRRSFAARVRPAG